MENFNENYDFTTSPETIKYNTHYALSHLTRDYWQFADEMSLQNVQEQIDQLVNIGFEEKRIEDPTPPPEESTREIMLKELEKIISNRYPKSNMFKLFK
ncbi:MAG: hypothetical protein WCO23_01305 [bacterium]